MTKVRANNPTLSKEPLAAPAEASFIDFSAPLQKQPDYPNVDYTLLTAEQVDGHARVTVMVDEDDLKSLEQLTETEQRDLERCERDIKATRESFYQFALALEEIRRRRLYRGRFKSFTEYCREVHGLGQSYAYRQAAVGRLLRENSPMGEKPPQNERQARKLIEKINQQAAGTKDAKVAEPQLVANAGDDHPAAAEIIPMPVPESKDAVSLHELAGIARQAYTIHTDNARREELGNLLLRLAEELGRRAKLEIKQQEAA